MSISDAAKGRIGSLCYWLGTLWAGAGVAKVLFGTNMTLPILPPIDLQRVHAAPAILVGCGLFALGAWLTRAAGEAALIEMTGRDQRSLLDGASHATHGTAKERAWSERPR